jgi:dephospho-CoA kinase
MLPPALARATDSLSEKDQRRLDDTVTRLHTVNGRLWDAEDQVRDAALSAPRVADLKREIDQLNAERNALAERADDILVTLAPTPHLDAPPHTETLASTVDRLSVLTLRIWHNERSARRDDLARRRTPVLLRQRTELCAAVDALVTDVQSGRVRLPSAARHKLYGRPDAGTTEITPSPRLERVIAFGGLSECGKSTSAAFLQHTCGAQRLKIGYLFRQAAQRHGLADPYALSARRRAELLLEELNRFAEGHAYQRLFTIESVHDDASITELKELMGDRLRIVYLNADFAERVRRSGTSASAVAAKDEIKMSRGAHRVATLADHVIDNSGSVIALRAQLRRISGPAGTAGPRTATPYGLGLSAGVAGATADLVDALRPRGPAVGLIALTGSPVEHTWIADWSDLDLLVVADPEVTDDVAAAVSHYQKVLNGAASVGLTLATAAELSARRLTPRVAFALHQLQEGSPVLYAAPGLELPRISRHDLALAAVHELPQVILTLRRLRADAQPDRVRQLYKHIVLACRLLLREHGTWLVGTDRILTASAALPGFPKLDVPPLAAVAAVWRDGKAHEVLPSIIAAADHLLAWYAHDVAA